jgi:dihydrodipicolinate synthase/N-acetylneuraminate lyase
MLTRDAMHGLYALPPTPFDERGNFWESAYRENLRRLIEFGVDAVVSPGSNGEWWTLDDDARRRQLEVLYEECHGKVVSAACCSSTHTEDSIRWTQTAEHIGLDAVMNVPPFYYPLTDDELRRYWHDLAEACPDIGLVVYNFPIVAQRLSEELMFRLADELPTLCGSKESHLDYNVWLRLHRGCDLAVFTAVERIWFTTVFRAGAKGIFSTLSASVPGLVTELYDACRDQDWARAEALEAEVWSLCKILDSREYLAGYNPIARNKALVNACGWLRAGRCRAPLVSAPEELVARLRGDLQPDFEKWLAPAERLATA